MLSAVQVNNVLHDLRHDINTAQVHNLHENVDLLIVGPNLLDETDQQALGLSGHDARATLSGQHDVAPTIDWVCAAASAAEASGTFQEKETCTSCLESPPRCTLHRSLHQGVDPQPPLAMGGLRERLASCERRNERLAWERSTLRGQLETALGRATAAEDRARVANELTEVAEERAGLAEDSARVAEAKAREAEAAVVRLTEEAAAIRAAAAASPMLPAISRGESAAADGPPIDFMDTYRSSWEPLQCRKQLLAKIHKSFAQSYRAARDALEPGSNLLRVEEELGRGGFGGVYKAVCNATGEVWAVKKPVTETDKEVLIYEILVYRSLPVHPNILRVLSVYDCLPSPALALECGTCDFHRALNTGLMPFADELECMADVVEGTGHCHDNGVVICDLKPSNEILVHDGARYVGKVADFGLACAFGQTRGAQCGTPGYFQPEVANSSTLAEPTTDAVSVGAMLAIVALQTTHRETNIFAHQMFWTPSESLQLQQFAQTDHDSYRDMAAAIGLRTMQLPEHGFVKKVTRPSLLNKMPGSSMMALRKLIRITTSANPAERPTMANIAPDIRAVASAVCLMVERAGTSASAATPESGKNNYNINNDIRSGRDDVGDHLSAGEHVHDYLPLLLPQPHADASRGSGANTVGRFRSVGNVGGYSRGGNGNSVISGSSDNSVSIGSVGSIGSIGSNGSNGSWPTLSVRTANRTGK